MHQLLHAPIAAWGASVSLSQLVVNLVNACRARVSHEVSCGEMRALSHTSAYRTRKPEIETVKPHASFQLFGRWEALLSHRRSKHAWSVRE